MRVTDLDLPEFDPLDPSLRGDAFHDRMRTLAAEGWLARSAVAVTVLDREAGSFFLRSKQTAFPGRQLGELFGVRDGPLHEEMERNILHLDGDEHRRLRNLVNPSFTPRAAARWRPAMQTVLAELLPPGEDVVDDLVERVAKPYPSRVIASVMGAPEADAPRLAEWSNWIQRQFDGPSMLDPGDRARIEEAVAEFYEYAGALCAERRGAPREDLVSQLLATGLDERGVVNLVLNVLVGGVDTTQSQLAHTVRLLAEQPEQWELLRSDPEALAPRAVEESLRVEPITPFTARVTTEDVTFRDVEFPAGTIVMVAAVSANREGLDDADRFDLTREPTKPLTFGAGIHFCLGANLARAELQEALVHLARGFSSVELAGDPAFGSINGIYGLDALPVRLAAA